MGNSADKLKRGSGRSKPTVPTEQIKADPSDPIDVRKPTTEASFQLDTGDERDRKDVEVIDLVTDEEAEPSMSHKKRKRASESSPDQKPQTKKSKPFQSTSRSPSSDKASSRDYNRERILQLKKVGQIELSYDAMQAKASLKKVEEENELLRKKIASLTRESLTDKESATEVKKKLEVATSALANETSWRSGLEEMKTKLQNELVQERLISLSTQHKAEDLGKDLEDARSAQSSAANQLKHVNTAREGLQKDLMLTKKVVDSQETELGTTKEALRQSVLRHKAEIEKVEQLQSQATQHSQSIAKLQIENETLKKDIQKAQDEKNTAISDRHGARTMIKALNEETQSSKAALKTLQASLQANKTQLQKLEVANTRKEREISKLMSDLKSVSNTSFVKGTQLQVSRAANTAKDQEISTLKSNLDCARDSEVALRIQIQGWQDTTTAKDQELSVVKSDLDAARNISSGLQTQLQQSGYSLDEKTKELSSIKSRHSTQLRTSDEAHKNTISQLQNQLRQSTDSIAEKDKELSSVKPDLLTSQRACQMLKTQLQQSHEAHVTKNEEISVLKKQVQEGEVSVRDVGQELEAARETIKKLKAHTDECPLATAPPGAKEKLDKSIFELGECVREVLAANEKRRQVVRSWPDLGGRPS